MVEAGDHDLVLGDILEAYVGEGYSPGTIEEYPLPLRVGGDLYAKLARDKTVVIDEFQRYIRHIEHTY